MSKFIPDENGELIALDGVIEATNQITAPGELGAAFAKMLLTLIALVALLLLSYWFIRKLVQGKMQKGSSNASIQVLEKRMISSKTMLYLVEIDQKKILLAESHLEIKRLETFDIQNAEYEDQ